MNNIKKYILEKLVITKDTKLAKSDNEEVLVLHANKIDSYYYYFDRKLFCHCLENLMKNHDNPENLIVFCDWDDNNYRYTSLYENSGPRKNHISHHIEKDISMINSNKIYKNKIINKYDCPQKLLNMLSLLKITKYDKFIILFGGLMVHNNNMYVWYSKKDDAICIYYSDIEYKTLLRQGIFNE